MSRSLKVEPEAAIQLAQALFWKHGYGGLGTRQIEEETGLTRFTLQTSYGGKKSLFLKTLDAYLDQVEQGFLPHNSANDLDGLAAWFERRASTELMPDISSYGCLMLNSTIEFQGRDTDVNQRSDRYFNSLRDSFGVVMRRAQADGTLDQAFDVEGQSELLLGIVLGLNVVIRAAADNAAGRQLARSAASMIRDWR